MKRTIAITLSALALAFTMIGCGSKDTGNVSDSTNGTVTESSGQYRSSDESRHSKTEAGTNSNANANKSRNETENGGFMNDMENAARDAGEAVGDAGRAVGDAITGNDSTTGAANNNAGTGMTGGR